MFQQVPLVEIDGMKMVQTRAILSYIAGKYNLYGKDLKERALYRNTSFHLMSNLLFDSCIIYNKFNPVNPVERHEKG